MKQKFYYLLLTALLGMTGMNAWAQTTYEISNADELAAFAQAVNGGETTANAVLTDDIDMSELESWTAIGDWNTGAVTSAYCGHFDGQGHTIKNFNFTSTHNYYGIFGVVSTGCLIENLTIYGTLKLGHKTGGVVGYSRDATPTIRNVHSYLTINVTEAATTAQRPGGILGSAVNGTTVIENCSYSGTLNVGGHTGNIGGIVGYVNNNAAAIVNITNCLFDGKILNGTTADGQCGGIVGYNNAGTVTIKNCLSIGTIVASSGNDGMFIGRLNGANTTFTNNYYVGDNVNGTASGKSAKGTAPVKVTDAQLKSGEICFLLNGSVSGGTNWFQTLKNMAFIAEQYVTTVNGETRAPQAADIKMDENEDGTFDFTLPNFVIYTNSYNLDVGDLCFKNLAIENDGTFSQNGTFSVPDENIPSQLTTFGVSPEALKNIPYTLNGKVNGDRFYATLSDITVVLDGMINMTFNVSVEVGTDDFEAKAPEGIAYPVPYGTDKVYANGTFNCDMTPKEGSEVSYSNTDASFVAAHDFENGFCTACGAFDKTYMTANEEGNFEIGTANQLKWFAIYVNQVDATVNAILTADIDLQGVEWTPIGKGVSYSGTFDGQGKTISNFNYVGSGDCNGLFGKVVDSTIKSFSINGTLKCAGTGSGVVGWSEGSTIAGIFSALTIDATDGTLHHAGGIVGHAAYGGTRGGTTVAYCSYTGTMTVNAASNDCFAGIAAYANDYCLFNSCANYGTITYENPNGYVGGILGYVNNTNCYGTHNCLNIGNIIYDGEGDPVYGGAIVGRLRGNNPERWGDSYWKQGSATQACGENQIPTIFEATDEQLASGEIAYKLQDPFGQEIGVDPYPVIGGKKVYELAGVISNFDDLKIEAAYGDTECILPSMKWGGSYQAYTYVAQGDFDFGDWNDQNPNYNVIIGTPDEQAGKPWYTPGYNTTSWNYGQDLPNFGNGKPADVYVVRYFTVDGSIPETLYMPAAHDDAPCEYYINGEQIFAETDGWYEDEVVRLTDEQKALIKTDGNSVNVFAFHVHQNWGGRYADGGLYTAGDPVNAFKSSVEALDATIALAETQGIDAEVIAFAKAKSNYRGGMGTGLAQLRKARRLAFDARTEAFAGTAPADGMIAYIYNVGAKMFLAGGNDWGTHASLNHMGAKCVLHANTSGANRYTIQTNLPNGVRGRNDGLGHNGYVDCGDWNTNGANWAWEIEDLGDGTYHIINCENSGANIYLGMTDDERLQIDTDKAGADNAFNKWMFVTPEEFEALAENATETAPVDLGHLVHQATFSQNDFDGNDKWAANCNAELGDSKWERNAGGVWGWKENWTGDMMFEMWNTASTGYVYLIQEVEGLPAGNYTVQMNGYYRDGNFESADEGNVRKLAYLFAGSEENCVPLVSIVEGSGNYPGYGRGGASGIVIPDGCGDAARFFQVGSYVNTIEAVVGADGKLKIGVFRNGGDDVKGGDWIVTDNWRLYYKGNPVEVTVTDAGYATFVAPGNIKTIPDGVEAFAAQANAAQGYVHLEPVTAIPAGEAVVLKAAEGTYTINASAFSAELSADNDLIAATEEVTADGTQYILAKQDVVGFAKATPDTKIAAGKGYLVITGGTEVKGFYPIGEDDATGISEYSENTENSDAIYNLSGQRIQKMQRGINIVGGKKVLK